MEHLRLGINIDHVATVRNARGGTHPDPVRAAKLAMEAGADGITAHLREDRRHIRDNDIARLKNEIPLPLNFEMAATEEMLQIALQTKPNACCLVPEKRTEVTTEGGLDVIGQTKSLTPYIAKLKDKGIKVSLFVDPEAAQVEASKKVGADIVELHTGAYCHAAGAERQKELQRIITAAKAVETSGIECHAGHGLCFETVQPIAKISNIVELNIGHFLIGESVFTGLDAAIKQMRKLMDEARS
ncbi:MAG: pdxJ [Rickettsiaceae bacterium]|jgi:pyridoxine 5-phosphate synthase|nr:pdxJ [Rickettsiaceae bacterium]